MPTSKPATPAQLRELRNAIDNHGGVVQPRTPWPTRLFDGMKAAGLMTADLLVTGRGYVVAGRTLPEGSTPATRQRAATPTAGGEAALAAAAAAAAAAQDDRQYADLPDWVRPGRTCDRIDWQDSTAIRNVQRVRIARITKSTVVVELKTRGETIEVTHRRSGLEYASSAHAGGVLLPIGTPEAADLRAVAAVRALRKRINDIVSARYTSTPLTRDSTQRPLKNIADALDVLREIDAARDAAHARVTGARNGITETTAPTTSKE